MHQLNYRNGITSQNQYGIHTPNIQQHLPDFYYILYYIQCHAIIILPYSCRQLIFTIRDSLRGSNLTLNELLTLSKYIKIIE